MAVQIKLIYDGMGLANSLSSVCVLFTRPLHVMMGVLTWVKHAATTCFFSFIAMLIPLLCNIYIIHYLTRYIFFNIKCFLQLYTFKIYFIKIYSIFHHSFTDSLYYNKYIKNNKIKAYVLFIFLFIISEMLYSMFYFYIL